MQARTALFALLACFVLAGGVFITRHFFWRPVFPEVVVQLHPAESRERPKHLMLIYGEAGSDPFRTAMLGPNRRISGCDIRGPFCIAKPARHEFRTNGTRRQSLQILEMNGRGNPIIGGVAWTGWSYPKRVEIKCDLGIADPRKACAVKDVVI